MFKSPAILYPELISVLTRFFQSRSSLFQKAENTVSLNYKSMWCFMILLSISSQAQLPVAKDTITVIENGYVLKMPWGNGINFANVSSVDLNQDSRKDLVVFDRLNQFSEGRFRCFINTGSTGALMYREDTYMSYRFPKAYNWAIFLDYDGDGKEDLFTAGNSNIVVYRNISNASSAPTFSLIKPVLMADISTTTVTLMAPLYTSIVGLPGISDVDNDGDLDILSFSSQGTFLEFYKNLSREKYNHSDSLDFKYANGCWGNVAESNCSVDFSLCTSSPLVKLSGGEAKEMHAGSCVTCMDSDGDGDKDLLMGDIACNKTQYVHNNGTPTNPLFNDTTKLYPNYQNANTQPIRINNFPCTYVLDADGDGRKDLLASPNSSGSENFRSLWFYKNTSTTSTVNFSFVKNNFLQDEMIEVGQNSYPVLFDFDADGKKDLLIGNFGYYLNNSISSRLTLYKNIGTASQPSYSLISRDYGSLSTVPNVFCAMPTVGDIDGDGDVDICIGTSNGQVHWLENTAGAGNVCNFSVFKNNPFQFTTNSAVAAPQLFDLDEDGLLDLLIGTKNGRIAFYRNTGTANTPAFSLVTNTLGGVLVSSNPNLFGLDGYAVPFFYKENNSTKLLVGSVSGSIFQYSVPSGATGNFNLITSAVNGFYEGGQSTIWYEDVNNDGKRDLFIGNASGGLNFFSSNSPLVGINENFETATHFLHVYPNPANDVLNITLTGHDVESGTIKLHDVSGRTLKEKTVLRNQESLSLEELNAGIYFVTVSFYSNHQRIEHTKKIIKE